VPGQPDMWVFVFFESLIFASYFCVYLWNRTQHSAAFLEAQTHLSLGLGILSTSTLLTSSWMAASCVRQARAGAYRDATRTAYLTAALGAVFVALKVAEWVRLISAGHTFSSAPFFQYFYFLTAIHLVHVLIGFVVLGVLVRQLRGSQRRGADGIVTVETCATYWHTVDFYWVMIFVLLYVVR
jgi:nitric oxide reductase NorE protein